MESGEHNCNGKVIREKPLSEVLNAMNIAPDFAYTNHKPVQSCLYVHRKLLTAEIYWVNNRNDVQKILKQHSG